MVKYIQIIAALFLLMLFSCFSSANAAIDANAFYVDKDHANASDTNSGTADNPWKTIQFSVNKLKPGERLYVRESTTPYFEPYRMSGSSNAGITIDVSGTVESPIYIEGYPGEKPVIDQQRKQSSLRAEDGNPDNIAASKPLSGFLLYRAHNIVLKNFEIINCSASGIMFYPSLHNNNIVIEDMHIHNLYGVDNVGGIRLDHADNARIWNNIIHDIYSTRSQAVEGNIYTNEPYSLHSGIHGYQPGNSLIEHNLIYNVSRGVFQKSADRDLKNSNTVRRNIFYNISVAAFDLRVQGVGSSPALNAKFYENIVFNAAGGVASTLHETSSQSSGFSIFNNTFYNVDMPFSVRGQIDVEIYNNIISESTSVNFATVKSAGYNNKNGVLYMGNNLYHNHSGIWILERYTSSPLIFRSLTSWKSASGTGLVSNPGNGSFEGVPNFVDVTNKMFQLTENAQVGGRNNGEGLGAYGLNTGIIGVLKKRSSAPTNLIVN